MATKKKGTHLSLDENYKNACFGDQIKEADVDLYIVDKYGNAVQKELPPPPPGYYYAPGEYEIRQEGENYVVDTVLTLKPIIERTEQDPDIREAAAALCDAVERYVCPKRGDKTCLRSELLNTKDRLRQSLKR